MARLSVVLLIVLSLSACKSASVSPAQASLPEDDATTLFCALAESPPRIDGELGDACWKNAAVAEGFKIYGTSLQASQQTRVLITFDDKNLYVAYVCRESDMSRIHAEARAELHEGENDAVWRNDCIELFLDPHLTHEECFQFEVDSLAQKWDAKITTVLMRTTEGPVAKVVEHPLWDSHFKAAATQDKDSWTVELIVPVAAMGVETILPGSVCGINFTRNELPAKECSSWMPWQHKSNFANSRHFGRLILGAGTCRLGEADFGARCHGTNRLFAHLTNATATNAVLELKLSVTSPSGSSKVFSKEVALAGLEEKTVTLEYEVPDRKGNVRLNLSLVVPDKGVVLAERQHAFEIPAPVVQLRLRNKSVYAKAKEVKANLTLNLGDVTRDKGTANIAILGGDKVLKQLALRSGLKRENELKLDIAGLKEGTYVIKACFTAAEGREVAEAETKLSIISDPFDW